MILKILKFGGSFFVNFVFYDFFRGQLEPRVKDRKQIVLILLLCTYRNLDSKFPEQQFFKPDIGSVYFGSTNAVAFSG